jgi:hypothetical protein
MDIKYTKWTENIPNGHIPNGHKIYQMAIKYSKGQKIIDNYIPFQGPQKCTQVGIFGMKVYHLATLDRS